MIGRNMLEFQLRRLGVFGAEETITLHPNLDEHFKISKCIINFQMVLYSFDISKLGYNRWKAKIQFLTNSLWSVWADHGDDVSSQYSGTPALKGDFVRYFPLIFLKFFYFLF